LAPVDTSDIIWRMAIGDLLTSDHIWESFEQTVL